MKISKVLAVLIILLAMVSSASATAVYNTTEDKIYVSGTETIHSIWNQVGDIPGNFWKDVNGAYHINTTQIYIEDGSTLIFNDTTVYIEDDTPSTSYDLQYVIVRNATTNQALTLILNNVTINATNNNNNIYLIEDFFGTMNITNSVFYLGTTFGKQYILINNSYGAQINIDNVSIYGNGTDLTLHAMIINSGENQNSKLVINDMKLVNVTFQPSVQNNEVHNVYGETSKLLIKPFDSINSTVRLNNIYGTFSVLDLDCGLTYINNTTVTLFDVGEDSEFGAYTDVHGEVYVYLNDVYIKVTNGSYIDIDAAIVYGNNATIDGNNDSYYDLDLMFTELNNITMVNNVTISYSMDPVVYNPEITGIIKADPGASDVLIVIDNRGLAYLSSNSTSPAEINENGTEVILYPGDSAFQYDSLRFKSINGTAYIEDIANIDVNKRYTFTINSTDPNTKIEITYTGLNPYSKVRVYYTKNGNSTLLGTFPANVEGVAKVIYDKGFSTVDFDSYVQAGEPPAPGETPTPTPTPFIPPFIPPAHEPGILDFFQSIYGIIITLAVVLLVAIIYMGKK